MAAAIALLSAVSLVIVGPTVFRAARDGRKGLEEGAAAIVRRDGAAATVEFSSARDLFADADRRLASPLAWPLRVVPVASTHYGVARSLTDIGGNIASAGLSVAASVDGIEGGALVFDDGRVDLRVLRTAGAALREAVGVLPDIERAIEAMPTGWVGGPLSAPRTQARDVLPSLVDGVRKAEAALTGLPSVLAEGGTKRYLIAFSNLSELRGSGGLFGFVTALEARDGDLDLDDFSGRPTEIFPTPGEVGLRYPGWFPDDFRTQARIFQNINMTTDFPTVGSFVLKTAETRTPLDGVIAVDPIGIAAVLRLTGPIRVPMWPATIDADNVAEIAMHDVYVAIENNDRREAFFEQLVRTTFDRLVTTRVHLDPATVGLFDQTVRAAHFRMYSEHERDQRLFDRLGVSGAVERAAGADDVLSVVSENASGNKADWFLRRDIHYEVTLDPEERTATTDLDVTFRNTAPSSGLPDYVIGSALDDLPPGTNRQIVLLVRPSSDDLESLTVDGRDPGTVTARESIFKGHRMTVEIESRGRSALAARSRLEGLFPETTKGKTFRLHVLRQAVARPDFAEIEIVVPKGWKATGKTVFLGDLTQDVVLDVRLERTIRGAIVHTVVTEPLRLARRLLDRVL